MPTAISSTTREARRPADKPVGAPQGPQAAGSLRRWWSGAGIRSPRDEYRGHGQDHCSAGFTMWIAGGRIKGGVSIGGPTNSDRPPCRTGSTSSAATPPSSTSSASMRTGKLLPAGWTSGSSASNASRSRSSRRSSGLDVGVRPLTRRDSNEKSRPCRGPSRLPARPSGRGQTALGIDKFVGVRSSTIG